MAYKYTRDKLLPGDYHVTNRARDGLRLFREDEDRHYFEYLVDRHVGRQPQVTRQGRPVPWLRDQVTLRARNLLYTHFHLILRQIQPGGMEDLMRRVMGTYVMRYNQKYGERGPLFRSEYTARRIESPIQFQWRVAYVHGSQGRDQLDWKFSSHCWYLDPASAPGTFDLDYPMEVFGGPEGYREFMQKHDVRQELDRELRYERGMFKP